MTPVFIIDGQTITGKKLKQNRIITVSTLIPETSTRSLAFYVVKEDAGVELTENLPQETLQCLPKHVFPKWKQWVKDKWSSNESYDKICWSNVKTKNNNRKFQALRLFFQESMQDIYKNKENILAEFEKELTMPENGWLYLCHR